MKYLLVLHLNPDVMDALSEEDKQAIYAGHESFIAALRESGEMLGTVALAEPAKSAVVRVRDGAPAVTDGPYLEAKEFLAGYYLVECKSAERAYELAAMIPDAKIEGLGVEVRPVEFSLDA
ncbi:MAG TPA: YciI family protein [Kribbella sp.]|nr:YciI family protein [Kribbella sp.]